MMAKLSPKQLSHIQLVLRPLRMGGTQNKVRWDSKCKLQGLGLDGATPAPPRIKNKLDFNCKLNETYNYNRVTWYIGG